MPDIPETVQWLLDFANIGCKLGELNTQRVLNFEPVKRPPAEPPKDISKLTPKEIKYFNSKDSKDWTPTELKSMFVVDDKGYEWVRAETGVYYGGIPRDKALPSMDAFVEFLSKNIAKLPHESISYYDLICLQAEVLRFLYTVMSTVIKRENDFTDSINDFLVPIFHYHTNVRNKNPLASMVCDYILEFWNQHQGLHPLLRQCKYCGTFWIEEKSKRGRSRKYCSTECEDKFNQPSRENDSKNKKRYRVMKYAKVKNLILEWLQNNDYKQNKEGGFRHVTQEEALGIYDKLPKKAKTSRAEFNRIYVKPKGHERGIT